MEHINYQKKMEEIIQSFPEDGPKPRLLLHSCCGPCSTAVLERLRDAFDITVYYYNPNIYPPEEYAFREREQRELLERLDAPNGLHFMKAPYRPEEYDAAVKGFEPAPEGGSRCARCFDLRLREAGRVAKAGNFDYFTTTLSLSPHKNAQLLNTIGARVAAEVGIPYLFSDFKKQNGFTRSVELTKEFGMYRQDYCGCQYSYRAAGH
ncbi:MAG: epoxyqueuosine reductase QueH [Peptoniphilaceae bacterium]|nr:epoxyqueuosine reductase QueH [Peptoniphilaceae bacterium]MDY6085896.1 epoxyqueuosine reductase QueH [Peptoniphilaceae bacterium]